MVDLQVQYQELRTEIDLAIGEVLASSHVIMGSQGLAFEAEAAERLGVKHAVGVASGTGALSAAL